LALKIILIRDTRLETNDDDDDETTATADATELANSPVLEEAPPPLIRVATIGIPTKIGTTAKSWNKRIPKLALPYLDVKAFLSLRIWRTKAEEERERLAAIMSNEEGVNDRRAIGRVAGNCAIQTFDNPKNVAVVTKNCIVPNPNIALLIDFSRSFSNSNPISKRKNTIPRSARYSVKCGPEGDNNPGRIGIGDRGDNANPTIKEVRI
jgi:hypothetical protein